MCSVDLDPCSVWRETPRIARKPHRCDACNSSISPGEAYLAHFDIFEGSATNEAACFPCWWAREQFATAHGQSFAPSGLLDQLRACVGENDDEHDEWRPVLASVLARVRISPIQRASRRDFWTQRRERRAAAKAAPHA